VGLTKNKMKGLKKKMSNKEWREFSREIVAGIFGGLVVAGGVTTYDFVKEKSFLWKILAPNIVALLLFIIIIFFLRRILLKKK